MWRLAEVTSLSTGEPWVDQLVEATDLHAFWGTDPSYHIVLSTDYTNYFIAFWCDGDERNIWINTRSPLVSEEQLDLLKQETMTLLPEFREFRRI
jgi:lipocalin